MEDDVENDCQGQCNGCEDFADLDELARTLLAFVDRYNQTARPFNWKFTASDLTDLLRRLSEREQPARQANLTTAA